MTDEEIHNIYLHMSGKAEGLVEATGTADFPVLFARAILEYEGLTKDMQNMASESTYKEQVETKDAPVAWEQFHEHMAGPNYVAPQRTWVGLTQEEFEKLINDAGFTRSDLLMMGACVEEIVYLVEAKLKERNT